MKELGQIGLFLCSCYTHILYVQRLDNDLHLDYFVSYRPEVEDRMEDFYIQIPLSKNDSIAKRMTMLLNASNLNEEITFTIEFENENENEVKKYKLLISKRYNLYSLTLYRTDLDEEYPTFIWEWCAYNEKFAKLTDLIASYEEELEDELYS